MASWMLSKKAEARIAEALTYKLASLAPGTEEHSEWAEFVANLRDEMPEAFQAAAGRAQAQVERDTPDTNAFRECEQHPQNGYGAHETQPQAEADAVDEETLFGAIRDNLSPHMVAAIISCLRINRTNNAAMDGQLHWFAEELVKLLGGPGQQTRLAEELGL